MMKNKTNILFYVLSLIFLFVSIILVVSFPDSQRSQVIAGGVTMFGFILNIVSYVTKN